MRKEIDTEPRDRLCSAFDGSGGWSDHRVELGLVQELLDCGIIQLGTHQHHTRAISEGEVTDHRKYAPSAPGYSGHENPRHTRLKLQTADFLEQSGHTINRWWNPSGTPEKTPTLCGSIEPKVWFGYADVGCEDCHTYTEAGLTQGRKLIEAFGIDSRYSTFGKYAPSHQDTTLYLVPYSQNPEDTNEITLYSLELVGDPLQHEKIEAW
ncbi:MULTISPECIES: hypothetical protein [unclassified Haloarcula]|uniref:hypothetical protein n=1 Tax=unclassified Haloarcula TaxID=2624677 RepID=UPI000EF1E019|nr:MULTISPECIES: hypothetical protein [unclassified Haloarcula]